MNVCACEASLEEAHERRDIDHLLYEASNRSSISITRSIVSDIRSTRVGRSRDGPRCGRDLYQDHQQPERIRSNWYEKQARKNASEAWDNDVRARAIERMRAIQCLAMTSSSWQQLCSILSNVIEADHHAKVRTTAITGSSSLTRRSTQLSQTYWYNASIPDSVCKSNSEWRRYRRS